MTLDQGAGDAESGSDDDADEGAWPAVLDDDLEVGVVDVVAAECPGHLPEQAPEVAQGDVARAEGQAEGEPDDQQDGEAEEPDQPSTPQGRGG